jgi:UDP-glucose 4-epimerase
VPDNTNGVLGERILITGGAGFIGRRLLALLMPGATVAVLDDLSVGLPMPTARQGLECYQADVRDSAEVARIMEDLRPTSVVHLAALHHIPSCEAEPRRAVEINVLGFQTILDECTRQGCKRVLLASSGAVYGFDQRPLSEDMPVEPCDVYAASKLSNEHQLSVWASRTDSAGLSARLFNAIGWDDPNAHLIPDILGRLANGRPEECIKVRMGNLHTRRDFVDVDDLAAGLAAMLRSNCWRPGKAQVYNLCSGREYSIPDIVNSLAHCMGVSVEIESDPALRRRIDRPSQWGDPQKTLREVGWQASIPLSDSIARIVKAWQAKTGLVSE